MTGNMRQGIGLLVLALLVGLVGLAASGMENDLGGLLLLSAGVVAALGLAKILADLLRASD